MADVDSKICGLEQLISYELEVIAERMKGSYIKFIPSLKTQLYDTADRLSSLGNELDEKLGTINQFVDGVDLAGSADEIFGLKERLGQLNMYRDFVQAVEEIERNVCNVLIAPNLSYDQEAHRVWELENLLDSVVEEAKKLDLAQSIFNMLKSTVSEQRSLVCMGLSNVYKATFSFPEQHVKDVYALHINVADPLETGQHLTALDRLGELEVRLNRLSEFIIDKLCTALISSGGKEGSLKITTDGTTGNVVTFSVKGPLKSDKHGSKMDAAVVFGILSELFTGLADSLEGVCVCQRPFTLVLGSVMQKQLMSLILKNVITVCVPVSCKKGDPDFQSVMNAAADFRSRLIEIKVLTDAAPRFDMLAESNERAFIDRRCLSILVTARELIMKPYLKLTTVGHGSELHDEILDDFVRAFGKSVLSGARINDENVPALLRLLKCQVSESCVQLVELLESTVQAAVEAENEVAAGCLSVTAHNIVQLFSIMTPKHHHASISSVPQQAAIFFNNCYYICHRIMMLPFGLLKSAPKHKLEYFRALFTDNLIPLRHLAADVLESLLAQCRRNLSAELTDTSLFSSICVDGRAADPQKSARTAQTLRRCTQQIEAVADVFREVMSETVYVKSIANLVSFLLTELDNMILGLEDIASKDAEEAATRIEAVIDELYKIFDVTDANVMHKMCEKAYFRTKEIVFCLNAPLQGIADRWCSGKGPLAQWLSAPEVRHLVKALFANTDQRKRLIDTIY